MLPPTHPAAKDILYKEIHEVCGDVVPINMVKGIGHLRDPRLNKVLELFFIIVIKFVLSNIFVFSVSFVSSIQRSIQDKNLFNIYCRIRMFANHAD